MPVTAPNSRADQPGGAVPPVGSSKGGRTHRWGVPPPLRQWLRRQDSHQQGRCLRRPNALGQEGD